MNLPSVINSSSRFNIDTLLYEIMFFIENTSGDYEYVEGAGEFEVDALATACVELRRWLSGAQNEKYISAQDFRIK